MMANTGRTSRSSKGRSQQQRKKKKTERARRGQSDEENIPTQQPTAQKEPWVQGQDENQERQKDPQRKASQGQKAHRSLTKKRLPRRARLRKRREFRQVYENGIRVAGRHMVLFGAAKPEGSRSRIGVTVTKKIGKAVIRSRCKRRLREIFRTHNIQGPIALDIVINAKKTCISAEFRELAGEFNRSVERLQAIIEAKQQRNRGDRA